MNICRLRCYCSVPKSCPILCEPMNCSTPGFPVLHHLLEFAQTHVHWVSDAIQPSHLQPLSFPFAFHFLSIRVFSSELALHIRWPKYWSFSFSISPSNEYSGLISFRIDLFDLLAVQGTLKSFPTLQLESISSLALSLLCGPALTSVGFPDSLVGKESACNAGDPGLIPGSGRSTGEAIGYPLRYSWASLVAQLVKNLPIMRETWVRSLGSEYPLEKGKAEYFSIVHGVIKSQIRMSYFHFLTSVHDYWKNHRFDCTDLF